MVNVPLLNPNATKREYFWLWTLTLIENLVALSIEVQATYSILSVLSNAHISTPFFRKTVVFSKIKYVLAAPLKILGDMYKFGIYVILKSSLQF
jgi:hypothetical protein